MLRKNGAESRSISSMVKDGSRLAEGTRELPHERIYFPFAHLTTPVTESDTMYCWSPSPPQHYSDRNVCARSPAVCQVLKPTATTVSICVLRRCGEFVTKSLPKSRSDRE